MKILIIEDEEKLACSIKEGLELEGFTADFCLDGERGLDYVEMNSDSISAIILDILLPRMNGFEVCEHIRRENIWTPVLFLAARDDTLSKVTGLNLGADDFLSKPFAFHELVARLKALLRRPKITLPVELKTHSLTINSITRKVTYASQELHLTKKEFALLEYLMIHRGRVVEREQLVDSLWDQDYDSFSNTVDVHIKNLRRKLKEVHNETLLETVRGVGFLLKK